MPIPDEQTTLNHTDQNIDVTGESQEYQHFSEKEFVQLRFAKDLITWHQSFFISIRTNYPEISDVELDLTVNRLINRLIFLRFAESKGLEQQDLFSGLLNEPDIYEALVELFHNADEKYNSGLFHLKEESSRSYETLDKISALISVETALLTEFINTFFLNNDHYQITKITVSDVALSYDLYLKHIHENLDESSIDEKDLLDQRIINYIVSKTIEPNLKGVQPGKRKLKSLKILDMCCRSGVFLLQSFQYLIDWHQKSYLELAEKEKSSYLKFPLVQNENGDWHLTRVEKKRILTDNIFGIDVARIAVESATFILLLKLIEDKDTKKGSDQLLLFREYALPDLSGNIKYGNPLIDSDILRIKQHTESNESARNGIKTFDWQKEFHTIITSGGFDVIAGNPPVDFSEHLPVESKPYLKQHYSSFRSFSNSYLLFYEKALKLIKDNGYIGFVVFENWLRSPEFKIFSKDYWIKEAVQNYSKSGIEETLITILQKHTEGETALLSVNNYNFDNPEKVHTFYDLSFINLTYFFGNFEKYNNSELFNKIQSQSKPLIHFAKPFAGYNPYEIGKGTSPEGGPHTADTIKKKPYHSQTKLNEMWKTEIVGKDINRYCLEFSGMRWVKYGDWLAAPRDSNIFMGERILVHERINHNNGRIEASTCNDTVYHGRDIIAIIPNDDFEELYYLLGLLNSKLLSWYYLVNNSSVSGEAFPKLYVSSLNTLPVKTIDQTNSSEKGGLQEMTSHVKRILDLNRKKLEIYTERDIATINQLINNIDNEIDHVVYSLYKLSEEEIGIIEKCLG